jgi:hypothetical protein
MMGLLAITPFKLVSIPDARKAIRMRASARMAARC